MAPWLAFESHFIAAALIVQYPISMHNRQRGLPCQISCATIPHFQEDEGGERGHHSETDDSWDDDELNEEYEPPPDDDAYLPKTTSEIENVLTWGSDMRLRVKLLLAVAGECFSGTPWCLRLSGVERCGDGWLRV